MLADMRLNGRFDRKVVPLISKDISGSIKINIKCIYVIKQDIDILTFPNIEYLSLSSYSKLIYNSFNNCINLKVMVYQKIYR